MNHWDKEACEAVDAAIFSGDMLETAIDEFEEYVERWQRAIREFNPDDQS